MYTEREPCTKILTLIVICDTFYSSAFNRGILNKLKKKTPIVLIWQFHVHFICNNLVNLNMKNGNMTVDCDRLTNKVVIH